MRALLLLAAVLALASLETAASSPPPDSSKLVACLAKIGGRVVDASQPAALRQAAQVWNMLYSSKQPAAIFYPITNQGVAAAVRCARAAGLKVTARNGGHSYMGYGTAAGVLTIDLSNLDRVVVSPDKKTAVVQGGTRQGKLYYEVWRQSNNNTAVVGGTCPSVGMSGFMLGGGLGLLGPQFGLGCDQVLSLTMVDAQGSLVTASKTQNPRLLAASCGGGGGNFGIVVEMVLKLVQVPSVFTTYTFEIDQLQAVSFLIYYQEVLQNATHPPGLYFGLGMSPDGQIYGRMRYPGRQAELEAITYDIALRGPKRYRKGAGAWKLSYSLKTEKNWIETMLLDSSNTVGMRLKHPADLVNFTGFAAGRNFFKDKSFCTNEPLNATAIRVLLKAVKESASWSAFFPIGPKSAYSRVAPDATAFPWRKALYCFSYTQEFENAAGAPAALAAANRVQAALRPFLPGEPAYINFMDDQVSADPMRSYYGGNAGWLRQLKRQFGPAGFFSTNVMAILPASGSQK